MVADFCHRWAHRQSDHFCDLFRGWNLRIVVDVSMSHTAGKWAATVSALLLLSGLALYLRGSDPVASSRFMPHCSFHKLTGLHCPGCGNTRATRALLHGDLGGAFRQNKLFVIGLPFLAFWACRSWLAWVYPHRVKPLPFQWRQRYTLSIVGVVIVFGILRNIPTRPFTWLAPVPVTGSQAFAKPEAPRRDVPPRVAH